MDILVPLKGIQRLIGFSSDGAGAVITTGVKKYIVAPFSGVITGWSIAAKESGSLVLDITKIGAGDTPPSASIVAGAAPALSSDQFQQSTTLTGWTTTVTAGDIIGFSVVSCSTITNFTFTLHLTQA